MKKNLKHNYPLYDVEPFTSFQDLISKSTNRHPDRLAFCYVENKEDKTKTYKEYYEDVWSLGTAIARSGYHDIHIAMVGENCYEWILTQMTVLCSDNVFVPIDKELPVGDLLNVVIHSDSELVFCTGAMAKVFAENRDKLTKVKKFIVYRPKEDLKGDFIDAKDFLGSGYNAWHFGGDDCFSKLPFNEYGIGEIVYTSGTTGDPKGVMLSKHNLMSSIYYGLQTMKVFSKSLSVLPYNHTYESTCDLLVSQHWGSTICINESLMAVERNFKKYQPDYVMLVPLFVDTFYKKIIKGIEKAGLTEKVNKAIKASRFLRAIGIDLRKYFFKDILAIFGGNMKMIVCGGAPIRPELAAFFDDIGIVLINGYGITECSPLLSANRYYYNDFRSVGVPLPCVEVRIEDPNEAGEGEIVVKGDIVMMGYYKNEAQTREVLSDDGWFATGDYGKMVGDRLYITGRKKNLIVLKNGKNVYPEEIEDYLMNIDGLDEVIVYALKDENGDEVSLCAEIHPTTEFGQDKNIDELSKYFREAAINACKPLPSYKQVTSVVVRRAEFPHTTSKKIKRLEVLKQRGLR